MKISKNCENSFILKIPLDSLKIWKLRKFLKILQNPKSTNDIQDFWIFSKYEFSRIKWDITQHGTWAIKITLFENEKKCLTPTFRKFDVVDFWIFALKNLLFDDFFWQFAIQNSSIWKFYCWLFGAKIQISLLLLHTQCCKVRLFKVIFNHCVISFM